MDCTGQGEGSVPAFRSIISGERWVDRGFCAVTVCFLQVCVMQRAVSICTLHGSLVLLKISDKIELRLNSNYYNFEGGGLA